MITDQSDEPRLALDVDGVLRDTLSRSRKGSPNQYAHRPVLVRNNKAFLGFVISQLRVSPERDDDDVIEQDIIPWWERTRRIMTGSDILGMLLRGIVKV